MGVEYVLSAFLAFSCQVSPSRCFWLEPGVVYQSRSQARWCVINRGSAPAPILLEFLPRPRMVLAPGVEPCPGP
jgi:hypothetical protein